MIYIILFILFAALVTLDFIEDANVIKNIVFVSTIILLIILSSIRWNTGPDWDSYFYFYHDINSYSNGILASSNMMEPGYTWINVWIHNLGFSYTGFLTIIAIITIGLKARVIYHHKNIMMIVLFLYYCYYLGDIVSVRQFTAVSLTFVASLYIIKKKPIIFGLFVFAATLIHISSILFIVGYWIYYRPYSKSMLYIFLIIALILGLVNISDYLINVGINLLNSNSDIVLKLLNYKKSGLQSTSNPYLAFILGASKRAIVLPIFIEAVKIIDERYRERYIGYLNLLVFGNAVYFLFALTIPVIQRLSVPFLIFEILIWGYLFISIKDRYLKLTFFIFLLLFGAFRLYFFMAPYMKLYFPFKTIF